MGWSPDAVPPELLELMGNPHCIRRYIVDQFTFYENVNEFIIPSILEVIGLEVHSAAAGQLGGTAFAFSGRRERARRNMDIRVNITQARIEAPDCQVPKNWGTRIRT